MNLTATEIELCKKAIKSHLWLISKAIEQKTWRSSNPARVQLEKDCSHAKELIQESDWSRELIEFVLTALDHHLHCHWYEWNDLEPNELIKLKTDVKTLTENLKSEIQ